MDRNTLQRNAAERLADRRRLICQWCTGCGKSGVVLQFLKEHHESTCLILVPEQNNIVNWRDEFSKFGVPMELVRVACYASFHKYKNTKWDLVVFDEAPHVDTEKRRLICESVKGDYILALGALIDDEETQALEDAYGNFDKDIVTLKQAIEWGILPSPTVCICHMSLNDTDRNIIYRGKNLTEKEMYRHLVNNVDRAVDEYNSRPNKFTRNRMLRAGSERKRLLGKLKDRAIGRICEALEKKGVRFLCFCASIKQAEALGGDKAFTSKTPVSMHLLEKFNNHEIDSLYVVGKLIEGQNLNDIHRGVIGQLGGTSRITIQSIGRIMRSEKPIIYLPIFDGTKDDSFLYTVTSNIPQDYIKHYKL